MSRDPAHLADHLELGLGRRSWPTAPWMVLRRHGERLRGGWVPASGIRDSLRAVLDTPEAPSATTLDIAAPHGWQRFDPGEARAFANRHRGLVAYGFALGEARTWLPPTETVATNRAPAKVLERFCERNDLDTAGFREQGSAVASRADQALVHLDGNGDMPVEPMYRGNRVVRLNRITGGEAEAMLERLLAWARANMAGDGALPYKHWPSRGEDATSDNVIRQLLATLGLIRAARTPGRGEVAALADANLARNIRAYLVERGDHAAMECGGKGKLGATALGALAILEHEGTNGPHAAALAKLRAGIDRQWREDGAFRTFLWPEDRNDCQNFYPGEALLFYAALYRHTHDAEVLDRALRTFRCYRAWHRERPNPAFVPWHTQACARLHAATGDDELRAFIFEMNDWLLTVQQWGEPLEPDLWGRFYAPSKPAYGPPHAASTGVYLEGLAVACELARRAGDDGRAESYRQAVRRGLRSLRQLQFVGAVDTFYIGKRARVLGALRTEAYDNEVRLDNVGHALLALTNLPAWETVAP